MLKLEINLRENQKLYFTSDLHLGHRNIIRFCCRPYTNEKIMDKALIDNWNNTVTSNDIVVIAGDLFWFNDSHRIKKVLESLNGEKIYIVPGNHDQMKSYHRVEDPRIEIITDITHIRLTTDDKRYYLDQFEIVVSHYPLMTWAHRDRGALNLFGHIHSGWLRDAEGFDQNLHLYEGLQYDVGVDNNNYKPVSFDEILIELNK